MSSKQFDIEKLREIIAQFSSQKVLVIGDLMWDEYIWGECNRISPEAPVPVVRSLKEEKRLGGAANVLNNLLELEVQAGIISVVGNDENAQEMLATLKKKKCFHVDLVIDASRPTSIKTRILAQNQQLLRLDRELTHALTEELQVVILEKIRAIIDQYDAVILSDYDKGLLTAKLIPQIIEICKSHNKILAVDPQVSHFKFYKGATVITPNEKEASSGIGFKAPANTEEVVAIEQEIRRLLNIEHILITRSEKGMALFSADQQPFFVPTIAKEVFDVSGAGDTVIAVFTAALCAKANGFQAAVLSNFAGGIVVGKIGTATITRLELSQSISELQLKLLQDKVK